MARMLISIAGAVLMLVGGVILLARPTIPLGPDGFAYVGFADGTPASPEVPVATILLVVGFLVVVVMAALGLLIARRGR